MWDVIWSHNKYFYGRIPVSSMNAVLLMHDLWSQMSIIFNEEGLQDVQPPCVAQTFINHNALLYKMFVIGQSHYVVERPSVKNFSAGSRWYLYDLSKLGLTSDWGNHKTWFAL